MWIQMNCCDCKHMKGIKNSDGDYIYLCVNTDSGAYLNETDSCGWCDLIKEKWFYLPKKIIASYLEI